MWCVKDVVTSFAFSRVALFGKTSIFSPNEETDFFEYIFTAQMALVLIGQLGMMLCSCTVGRGYID